MGTSTCENISDICKRKLVVKLIIYNRIIAQIMNELWYIIIHIIRIVEILLKNEFVEMFEALTVL